MQLKAPGINTAVNTDKVPFFIYIKGEPRDLLLNKKGLQPMVDDRLLLLNFKCSRHFAKHITHI